MIVVVGTLERPHGLKGEISLAPAGDPAKMLVAGSRVQVRWPAGQTGEMIVDSARPAGRRWLVQFRGVSSPEAARKLCRGSVLADSAHFERPREDFVFDHEIGGFRCLDRAGAPLGVVRRLERYGPVATLVLDVGGEEILVPFAYPIVVDVRTETREIVLDPPIGLLPAEGGA